MRNNLLFHSIFYFLFVFLLAMSSNSFAKEPTVEFLGLSFVEDKDKQLNQQSALSRFKNKQATPIEETTFNQGSRESHYWLALNFKNTSLRQVEAKLLTGAPYRVLFKAYLYKKGIDKIQDNDQGRLILDESEKKTFSSRKSNYRYLNSESFSLEAGEKASILIQYKSRGATFLPLSIETEQSFDESVTDDLIFGAITYSFSLTLGILFLLLNVAMKYDTGIYYAVLFLLGLLFIATVDGYAFKYLWPESPHWNQYASLIILFGINAIGFFISYKVCNLNSFRRLFKSTAWILAILNLVLILFAQNLNFSMLAGIANILLFIMFVFQFIAISSWVALKRNKITSLSILVIALFIGVLATLFFVSEKLPSEFINYSNYITYLLISVATMTIITAHMIGLRKDNEAALEEQLASAKREAKINKSLFETEQKYSQVREIARLRQQQLATASHDIRQPLVSLRSTMDSISRKQKPEIREQLHNAFDYMEQLCNSYLKESRPENDQLESAEAELENQDNSEHEESTPTDSQEKEQPYPVSLILNTTKRMFEDEAKDKGLEFKVVDSSVMIQEPPLILIRIVSNFVSNAVKHSDDGKILVGCRRQKGKLRIEVHDTGKGIAQNAINKLQEAYQKGEDSKGEGLGLAITQELAKQHGMEIVINSVPGKGSCFAVAVNQCNA